MARTWLAGMVAALLLTPFAAQAHDHHHHHHHHHSSTSHHSSSSTHTSSTHVGTGAELDADDADDEEYDDDGDVCVRWAEVDADDAGESDAGDLNDAGDSNDAGDINDAGSSDCRILLKTPAFSDSPADAFKGAADARDAGDAGVRAHGHLVCVEYGPARGLGCSASAGTASVALAFLALLMNRKRRVGSRSLTPH